MSHRLSIMVFAVLTVLSGCGGGGADPFGTDAPAGDLETPGIDALPNNKVDYSTRLEAFDQISAEVYTAALNAARDLSETRHKDVDSLRTLGAYCGYTLSSGSKVLFQDSLSHGLDAVYLHWFDIVVTFKSFSNTGRILLDGELTIHSQMEQAWGWYRWGHTRLNGALDFKGDWNGRIEYLKMPVPFKQNGELFNAVLVAAKVDTIPGSFDPLYGQSGNVSIKSNNGEFYFNPFYF